MTARRNPADSPGIALWRRPAPQKPRPFAGSPALPSPALALAEQGRWGELAALAGQNALEPDAQNPLDAQALCSRLALHAARSAGVPEKCLAESRAPEADLFMRLLALSFRSGNEAAKSGLCSWLASYPSLWQRLAEDPSCQEPFARALMLRLPKTLASEPACEPDLRKAFAQNRALYAPAARQALSGSGWLREAFEHTLRSFPDAAGPLYISPGPGKALAERLSFWIAQGIQERFCSGSDILDCAQAASDTFKRFRASPDDSTAAMALIEQLGLQELLEAGQSGPKNRKTL